MSNYNFISRDRWRHLRNMADQYESVGTQYGKTVTYLKVKVWMRDRNENIRYSHVLINETWY